MYSDRIVKALFLIASEPPPPSAAAERYADVERLLIEMSVETTGAETNLLNTAMAAGSSTGELMRLKELAKQLARDAAGHERIEAARLLYHVSVASAFLHHGTLISGRDRAKQRRLYEALAEQWAGHPTGELFARMAVASNEA